MSFFYRVYRKIFYRWEHRFYTYINGEKLSFGHYVKRFKQ